MPPDTPFAEEDGPDERLRPSWESTADETEADRIPRRRRIPATGEADPLAATNPALLLATLRMPVARWPGSTPALPPPTPRCVRACWRA